MLLLREAHTNKYTHHERLPAVQTRMTSERISGTGVPTIEEQASQTLHDSEPEFRTLTICPPP